MCNSEYKHTVQPTRHEIPPRFFAYKKHIKKADANKMRAWIVPLDILTAISAVREYDIKKSDTADGWEEVETVRYYDALFRHMIAMQGNLSAVDEESGLLHLWHVACNAAFLCALV